LLKPILKIIKDGKDEKKTLFFVTLIFCKFHKVYFKTTLFVKTKLQNYQR